MKIGFIIVNYNDAATTKLLISNIESYKVIDTILVVDNNSTDDSYNELKCIETDHIRIVNTMSNKGYGAAINYGAAKLLEIGIEWSFISNSDIVIEKESVLKRLIDDISEKRAWIAPVIKEHQGFNRGFKIERPMDSLLLSIPYFYKFFRKNIQYSNDYYKEDIVQVEVLSGCFFLISLKALKEVDYFDERVFLYYEEAILSKKLQPTGKQIALDTTVSVFHNHSVTINKNLNRIKKYKILKKSQRYFQKEYNHATSLVIGLHFLLEKVSIFILTIDGFFHK